VDGKTYSHQVALRRDPRIDVSDRALHQQFVLANAIEDRIAQIHAATAHAQALLKSGKLSAAQAREVRRDILGLREGENPDFSVGGPANDFSTLRYLGQMFSFLEGAVESADVEPTADQRTAYAILTKSLDGTIAKLAAIAGPK
jgi:hypothetical protein